MCVSCLFVTILGVGKVRMQGRCCESDLTGRGGACRISLRSGEYDLIGWVGGCRISSVDCDGDMLFVL